jgi:catechol 2,3-dioxygenase-like lactoylglutathione lyase family enzyme
MTATTSRIKQVASVMVPVSDQDQAVEFFLEKLGFEKRADIPYGEGERWVEVAVPGDATTIALVPPRDGQPAGTWSRLSFVTDDVDASYSSLQAGGVDVDAEIMRIGSPVPPMFFFRDHDGNSFLIVEGG